MLVLSILLLSVALYVVRLIFPSILSRIAEYPLLPKNFTASTSRSSAWLAVLGAVVVSQATILAGPAHAISCATINPFSNPDSRNNTLNSQFVDQVSGRTLIRDCVPAFWNKPDIRGAGGRISNQDYFVIALPNVGDVEASAVPGTGNDVHDVVVNATDNGVGVNHTISCPGATIVANTPQGQTRIVLPDPGGANGNEVSCVLTVNTENYTTEAGATLSGYNYSGRLRRIQGASGDSYILDNNSLTGGGLADAFQPTVLSIVRQSPTVTPTNADSLVWRITFSESVQNVDAGDFSVSGTTATVTSVASASANTVYDVTVSGGDLANLNATVTLALAGSQNIQDSSGNPLSNTTPSGANEKLFDVANVVTTADMSVDLTGLPTTTTVGTPYAGTIKCTNSASATASALSATCGVSGLPAGLSLGSCSPVPPASVAAGASITCPVSGTPTSTASATVTVSTGATNDANAGNNSGTATIGPAGTPGLTLATAALPSKFSGVGQSIGFTYTVTNSGNVTVTAVSVSDTKVSPVTCAATPLAAGASTTCTGTYTTTAADVRAAAITSSATARGTFGATPVASAVVITTVEIDAEAVRRATKVAIQGFMSRRADTITSTGPDTGRMHDRMTGSLFGGGAAPATPAGLGGPRDQALAQRQGVSTTGAGVREALARDRDVMAPGMEDPARAGAPTSFGFSGAADDGAGRFAFSTSLAKMRAAVAAEQAQKEGSGLPAGLMSLGAIKPTVAAPSRFDVWTEGAYSYYSSDRIDGKRQGHAGLFFAGADYLVMPGLLVGAMAQLDWMNETSSTLLGNADGRGWMAGPYVSAQLTPNLFFDARALWGRSRNHIDPLGAYTDSFDTARALTTAKLTGRWSYGALTFQPSAEIVYFSENQKAYTNAIGIDISSQSVHLGRLTFGPEVGYRLPVGDGGSFEPFVGLKGVWDFAETNETTAAGEPIGQETWRGRIEAGATLRTSSGIALRAQGSYDGLGDSQFQAWQGRATIVVPLQ